MRKLLLSFRKKKIWGVDRFWRSQTPYLHDWEIIGFTQQKENQLVITNENNELNQKLTEIVVGIKVNQWKCEDGFKILKQGA